MAFELQQRLFANYEKRIGEHFILTPECVVKLRKTLPCYPTRMETVQAESPVSSRTRTHTHTRAHTHAQKQ